MSDNGDDVTPEGSEEIVAMYTAMFSHRYTDEDEEFVKTRDNPLPDPPCVPNWFQRPKRNFDFARGGRGRGGGGWNRDNRGGHGGHRRSWEHGGRDDRRHRDNKDNRDNRDNRVHYAGRRDNRQQGRYQPYDQNQLHQGQYR